MKFRVLKYEFLKTFLILVDLYTLIPQHYYKLNFLST